MTVIPQEASTNVDSDGQVVARELARDVRVTEVGPSVRIQRHEARDCNCDCDCPSCLSEPVGWCILLTAFIISVPALAIIIIGSVHFHECPAMENLPIYLIMAGVLLLLLLLSPLCLCEQDYCEPFKLCYICLLAVLCLLLAIANISALVSVFSPQEIVNTSNPRSPHYCNNIVYTSAKYSACITAPFSFLICCRCCYSCCCSG
ncbi:uncharacterized protein LOC135394776 isoform X2 [Ornithodoros turicata]